ncbi:hypothetical protein [Megamonas sp.]|uniref:hypothetical protein n=1 Tax=Megamonas sp. TaxID=2049033 RepID=UPI002584D3B8|nr:hypothetical protein [Megamonas sp.]
MKVFAVILLIVSLVIAVVVERKHKRDGVKTLNIGSILIIASIIIFFVGGQYEKSQLEAKQSTQDSIEQKAKVEKEIKEEHEKQKQREEYRKFKESEGENKSIEKSEKDKQDELDKKKQEEENKKLEEAKKSDITLITKEPTHEQGIILNDLMEQKFKELYPIDGSRIHTFGAIQTWTGEDDSWFYKGTCTIANEFGSTQKKTIEVTIVPESKNSGNVTIMDY